MTKLLSFHNDESIKEKYLSRVKAHQKLDNIIKGQGWSNGKGCAIGCTLENYDRTRYPIELGIPIEIAILEDCIFEGLDLKTAKKWPSRFLEAVPVGANLEMVFPKFGLWLLENYIPSEYKEKPEIKSVIEVYQKMVNGEITRKEDIDLDRAIARDRDFDRALARTVVLARDLALALALARALDLDIDPDLDLALDLARALARARAVAQNRSLFWVKCSDKLIDIIKETK
jgi:hypothetical protein